MTTIERAKRFFKRIHYWAGEPSPAPKSWQALDVYDYLMGQCQARVARALIRREAETFPEWKDHWNYSCDYQAGLLQGLERALDIIDAVYGRDHDHD